MMDNTVIGVVYTDNVLTTAVRSGRTFVGKVEQRQHVSVHAAAASVLALASAHRHTHPCIYLQGEGAQPLHDMLVDATRDGPAALLCSVIDWFAEPGSTKYRNKGSELFAGFVSASNQLMPPAGAALLGPELAAFRREEVSGVVVYPSPETVAEELERYPAHAMALLMAVQPEAASVQPQDVYGRHDPLDAGVGHSPWD